ncbi:MAG: exosortase H [Ottowia sp.]|nr:exosortase H [Ottowia sp.]
MVRFFLIFIALLAVLFRIDMLDSVQAGFVEPWTDLLALLSAGLIQPFDADVHSYGRVLQSTSSGFGVSIEPGCNGVEAAIVLVAAVLAFPASWKAKLIGVIAGIVAIQAVNLVRIISLFYIGQWNFAVFEFAHYYLWQALIMLDALVTWLVWLHWTDKRKARRAAIAHDGA